MSVLHDLRYGARKFSRNPGFTAVSVLTMALGIGLTAMMFSIVYAATMRGLPFEDADRIVAVWRADSARGWDRMSTPIHDYEAYVEQQRAFSAMAAYYTGTINVSGTEAPERFDGGFVTHTLFPLLGVQPTLGRTFRPEDDVPGAPLVTILSHRLWQDRYGGDPRILGTTIRTNGQDAEVIGVMPEGFQYPAREELWVPLRLSSSTVERGEGSWLQVVGRLRDGVDADEATVQLAGIARRLAAEYPEENANIAAFTEPLIQAFIGDEPRQLLFTMLAAVFGVLLIACANVANLLLGQAAQRAREVGIRTALGASRLRITMQFLTEPLVLAAAGAVLGVGLAYLGLRAFEQAVAVSRPPYWLTFGVDGPVLLFVLGVTVFAAVVSGLLPALRASKADVHEVLKDEGRGSSSFRAGRLSRALVVAEVALSVGLLAAAGLMIKSVAQLRNVDYGFDPAAVFTARVGLPEAEYPDSASQVRFWDQLQQRLAEVPDATGLGLASGLPVLGGSGSPVAIEGKAYAEDRELPNTGQVAVGPGSFAAMGVRLVSGRDVGPEDRETTLPVVVVNESFARTHFGAESPLGRRIRLGGLEDGEPWRTVVGVVPDLWMDGMDNEDPEAVYVPYTQSPQRFMSIVGQARGRTMGLTGPVRAAVQGIDPDLPIYFVDTLENRMKQQTWFYNVFGTLFMVMGFVALFLASIGLYGVMAFSVSRRTREMGVRMALGAGRREIVRLVMRQGIWQLAVGVVLGLGLAVALGYGLQIVLFQVKPTDPLILASIVAALTATGLLACFIPARRATRVDPMVALRYD